MGPLWSRGLLELLQEPPEIHGAQGDFRKMNQVYLSYFKGGLPARSTCITGLAVPGMLLEIECVAYLPRGE